MTATDISFGGCPGVTKLSEEDSDQDDSMSFAVDASDFPKHDALMKLGGSTRNILPRCDNVLQMVDCQLNGTCKCYS